MHRFVCVGLPSHLGKREKETPKRKTRERSPECGRVTILSLRRPARDGTIFLGARPSVAQKKIQNLFFSWQQPRTHGGSNKNILLLYLLPVDFGRGVVH